MAKGYTDVVVGSLIIIVSVCIGVLIVRTIRLQSLCKVECAPQLPYASDGRCYCKEKDGSYTRKKLPRRGDVPDE